MEKKLISTNKINKTQNIPTSFFIQYFYRVYVFEFHNKLALLLKYCFVFSINTNPCTEFD